MKEKWDIVTLFRFLYLFTKKDIIKVASSRAGEDFVAHRSDKDFVTRIKSRTASNYKKKAMKRVGEKKPNESG
jgi:hypothetical protein